MSLIDITDVEKKLAGRIDNAAAQGLVVSDQAGGVQFQDASQIMNFSKMMAIANSGVRKHLRGNPGACLAICVQAVEWGLSPFAVANKSYFVSDQIAFESQLIQAVILKRAPIKGRIKFEFSGEGADRKCRAWARLKDEDEIVEYVSPLFKDITPKNSPLWKADPDQQMCYVAGRALCRRHFPDILLGVYADDELPAPSIGPERARDVTPRSLGDKLDALAAARNSEAEPDPQPEDVIQDSGFDPETGEITETAESYDQSAPAADDAEPDDSPRGLLLDKLRAKATQGSQRLKLAIGKLAPTERWLLTEEDIAALQAAAGFADGGRDAA